MSKHDGGPAFPLQLENRDQYHGSFRGMSLRDWFAGQALAGICAVSGIDFGGPEGTAKLAYRLADAMLAERAKTKED